MTEIQPFPLRWPSEWPRTEQPKRSSFQTTANRARKHLMDQLRMLGATDIVVTTDVAVRRDGLPYAKQRAPEDQGVAVYFTIGDTLRVIPCDRWASIDENIRAIGLTVEALRGLERWGAKEIVERAFSGFDALPASVGEAWWEVLGLYPEATAPEIETAYRLRLKTQHPDVGGDPEQFYALQAAYDAAKRERMR